MENASRFFVLLSLSLSLSLSHSSSSLFRSANENGDGGSVGDGESRPAGRDPALSRPERPDPGRGSREGLERVAGGGREREDAGRRRREKKKSLMWNGRGNLGVRVEALLI
jgi:hypothetical protein